MSNGTSQSGGCCSSSTVSSKCPATAPCGGTATGKSILVSECTCGTVLPCPIPAYRDDAEAKLAGKVEGDVYQLATGNTYGETVGLLKVVQA